MKQLLFLSILLITNGLATAQIKQNANSSVAYDRLAVIEDSMAQLAKIAVQDTVLAQRQAANERLLPLMRTALSLPNAFAYPFEKVENSSSIVLSLQFDSYYSFVFYIVISKQDLYC